MRLVYERPRSAEEHELAENTRRAHAERLLEIEAELVPEEERCYDALLIAAALLRASAEGDAEAKAALQTL